MPVKQNFQYILVAVDFSPASEAAWKQAAWLARNPGVSLTLMHSIADSSALVHSNSVLDALCDQASSDVKLREDSDKKLRRIVSESNLGELDIECVTIFGEPFVEIIRFVQEENFDLVLIGTQGHSARSTHDRYGRT